MLCHTRLRDTRDIRRKHNHNSLLYHEALRVVRDESRGAHYKPQFPERNDQEWLKTTVAKWKPEGIELSYEAVDTSLLRPRERMY